MKLIITFLCITLLFLIVEGISRKFHLINEYTRKSVHITSAVLAASFPYWLNRSEIIVLAVVFTLVMYISKRLRIFQSIHETKRSTYGEIFFPIGIGLTALFIHEDIAYTYGILILGLSDGLAGLVGSRFGKNTSFRLFKSKKSIIGSLTFFITTLAISLIVGFPPFLALTTSVALMILEISLGKGLDNLLLPIAGGLLYMTIL